MSTLPFCIPDSLPLLTELLSAWPTAMPDLISPQPHAMRCAQVPAVAAELDQILPHSSPHIRGCLKAALWLLADNLDRGHTLCQDIPTTYGSAWHAVMHRREADFSNSCYWWRRAPGLQWPETLPHQLRAHLQQIPTLESEKWQQELTRVYDPATLVTLVERGHHTADSAWRHALLTAQRLEWAALFNQCLEAAMGTGDQR